MDELERDVLSEEFLRALRTVYHVCSLLLGDPPGLTWQVRVQPGWREDPEIEIRVMNDDYMAKGTITGSGVRNGMGEDVLAARRFVEGLKRVAVARSMEPTT
jgi:hypothetical protein